MFRYLDLVRKYVAMTDKLALNPQYKKPIMPEYEYYFRQHHTPGKDYCYDAWMQYSKPLYHLAKLMMRSLKIEEIIRVDGTFKIGKRAIVVDESKKSLQHESTKVLMLATNEINQWVSLLFSAKEDKEAMDRLFEQLKPKVTDESHVWVVCDNTDTYRSSINKAFPLARTKQDPFHVTKRPSPHITQSHKRISTKLMSDVLYDKTGQFQELRHYESMQKMLDDYERVMTPHVMVSKQRDFQGTMLNTKRLVARLELDLEGIALL